MFTREQIIDRYVESNRFSKDSTKRQLAIRIKRAVQGGYINPLQDKFSILDEGIKKAKEIFARTTATPKEKKKKRDDTSAVIKSEKSAASKTTIKRLTTINFEPEGKESLKSFFVKHQPKNDYEKNLLFVFYLQEILKINDITVNHIYSSYDILQLKISENLPQTIRNTSSKTGWIEVKNSKISLTIKGQNQIKAWAKKQ
jgi:hypothetical protein